MQKFTGAGAFLTKWGSFGTGEGQFNLPYGVRAGADGLVYVADSSNHRVQKFGFASCPADLDGDGDVDAADIAELLVAWGANPGHPADFDGDGDVDAADLAELLAAWGRCS